MKDSINIFWFRRDLRLDDNAGLYHALDANLPVLPMFIFDSNILDKLHNKADLRVSFIYKSLINLNKELSKCESCLTVKYGKPTEVFKEMTRQYKIAAVFTNHDYEPYAIQRDKAIADFLEENGIAFHTYKDEVIFEKSELIKDNGEPYTVFTPYSKKWQHLLTDFHLKPYPVEKYINNILKLPQQSMPSIEEVGFKELYVDTDFKIDAEKIKHYHQTRDFPYLNGTTRLGVHLRFGTISIRKLATIAKAENSILWSELIWRDFYQMILWHFPHVVDGAFKPAYNNINWRNDTSEFELWCTGNTGYPIVDAGMRELNETGYMHNRVRMICASFLTKHILIDWRWGEAYFAKKLLDYDLAANNGGWQWAAGSGCDAAPYFRIFNPYRQAENFDREKIYIKRWIPELNNLTYPKPMIEHAFARERCLQVYSEALKQKK